MPPPYPYERSTRSSGLADSLPGGVVDCSIGTPCDPVPEIAGRRGRRRAPKSMGYPQSAGSPALREAAAGWIGRRFGVAVEAAHVGACVGTKEIVVVLAAPAAPAQPAARHRAVSRDRLPELRDGRDARGLPRVPVPLDADWHLDLTRSSDADAERALVLWVNEPGNPCSSAAGSRHSRRSRSGHTSGASIVASDECYTEYAPEPATILASGLHSVLAMHSLSKRSNLAGMRVGFYAGDADLVDTSWRRASTPG